MNVEGPALLHVLMSFQSPFSVAVNVAASALGIETSEITAKTPNINKELPFTMNSHCNFHTLASVCNLSLLNEFHV